MRLSNSRGDDVAKTAPTNFPVVPQGSLQPLEPIMEGAASPIMGWQDLAQALNHATRYLTPTVIMQMFQAYTPSFPVGTPFLDTAAQPADGVMTDRCCWRIPTIAGIRVPPTVYTSAWCAGIAAARWQIRSLGSGASVIHAPGALGAWTDFRGGFQYSTAAAYDTLVLSAMRVGGIAGDHCGLKTLTVWLQEGDNPQPAGIDVEPWVADRPLATYMHRLMRDRLDALIRQRVGVVLSFSDDLVSLGRPRYAVQNPGGTPIEVQLIRDVPVQAGPLRQALRIHVNGFSTGAADQVRIWTDTTGQTGGTLFALPIAGAFLPLTGWQTGTVALTPQQVKTADRLHLSLIVQPGQTAQISGLCVWEEPM